MANKILLSGVFLIAPFPSLADHVGFQIDGGAGSAITTIGAETLAESQQVLALQYRYLELDELRDQTLFESDEALHSVSELTQFSIGYSLGVSDKLTVTAMLPYVSRDGFREASHDHHGAAPTSHTDQTWQYVLEINGEWRDKTDVDGGKDGNTGGNVIFASLGLRWGYGSRATHMSLTSPVFNDLNGIQSEPEWRLSTGVSLFF